MTFYAVSDYAIYLHSFSGLIDSDYDPPFPPGPDTLKPVCYVCEDYNGGNVMSELGEVSRWPMNTFIAGFNITYKINDTSEDDYLSIA